MTGPLLLDKTIDLAEVGRECLYFIPAVADELTQRGVAEEDAWGFAHLVRDFCVKRSQTVTYLSPAQLQRVTFPAA